MYRNQLQDGVQRYLRWPAEIVDLLLTLLTLCLMVLGARISMDCPLLALFFAAVCGMAAIGPSNLVRWTVPLLVILMMLLCFRVWSFWDTEPAYLFHLASDRIFKLEMGRSVWPMDERSFAALFRSYSFMRVDRVDGSLRLSTTIADTELKLHDPKRYIEATLQESHALLRSLELDERKRRLHKFDVRLRELSQRLSTRPELLSLEYFAKPEDPRRGIPSWLVRALERGHWKVNQDTVVVDAVVTYRSGVHGQLIPVVLQDAVLFRGYAAPMLRSALDGYMGHLVCPDGTSTVGQESTSSSVVATEIHSPPSPALRPSPLLLPTPTPSSKAPAAPNKTLLDEMDAFLEQEKRAGKN